MSLTAAACLDANDLDVVEEQVPEWGGSIKFRQLSAEDTLQMTEDMEKPENKGLGMFLIIIRTAVNDDGVSPLFTDADLPKLRRKSMKVLNRLQRAALRVNSMLPEDGVALKKD